MFLYSFQKGTAVTSSLRISNSKSNEFVSEIVDVPRNISVFGASPGDTQNELKS